ncbi:hypothetical protein Jab_1c05290 [Janthinobacterium sp. HH01]|uniref:toxin-antitoxin system TumE family protein n=1 Tax=Janthinobacterium sp. HH01 TaxID=1198452 RepID=UPI0002AECF9E|nr:DUF6516 family protein [Janthinobacterium sp. HH01]ELX11940.1 hypothetical protein Jab_1c05290 [Janthinobacterium sp. HH01]
MTQLWPAKKIINTVYKISDRRGNGLLRREIWITGKGQVTRYNLAYINHDLYQRDNGRVIGYDNAHGVHHRHRMGVVEPVEFTNFDDIETRFQQDWQALLEKK